MPYFDKLNGKSLVLHHNMQLPKERRRLENVLSSPRKASHSQVKLIDVDTPSKDGRLKCKYKRRSSATSVRR